jgi:pimeloyl-ACP methyl ester carboxylesterase
VWTGVDPTAPVLAGFSLGSYAILQLAVQDPSRFSRIALVEGVTDGFDDARARGWWRATPAGSCLCPLPSPTTREK